MISVNIQEVFVVALLLLSPALTKFLMLILSRFNEEGFFSLDFFDLSLSDILFSGVVSRLLRSGLKRFGRLALLQPQLLNLSSFLLLNELFWGLVFV